MGNLQDDTSIVKFPFLVAGEMSRRISEKDWGKTSLGSFEKWPPKLRLTLNILLRNPLPSFLFWSSDQIIFFNDAARYLLEEVGNFENILGLSAKNSLPPGWKTLKKQVTQVFNSGESILIENKLMPFSKNKKEKQAYWTFSFSCVVDESEMPEAVMLTAIEIQECPQDYSGLFEEVSQNVEQLNYTLEAAELGTWNVNIDTNKIVLNNRGREWFGLSEGENPLVDLLKTIVEEDRQSVIDEINKALTPGSDGIYQKEYSILNPITKEKRRILAKGKAQFNSEKRPYRFSGILQDITEESILLEKLKNTEERLLLSIETAQIGLWEFNLSEQKITHSQIFAELLGFEKSTILGIREINKWVHPEDLPFLENEFMPQLLQKGKLEIEYRIIQQTGDIIWVRNHSKVIYDKNGLAIKLIGTLHDITKQKEYQKKIEESEENLRTIVETGPFPISVYSGKEGRLEMANKAWANLLGRDENFIGKKFLEIFPEYKHQEIYKHFEEALKGIRFQSKQERVDLEREGIQKTFYFNITMTPVKNEEGKVIRIINSSVDVTESVLAKNKIEESEAGFRLLANSMPQFVLSANKEGTILYANKAVFEYTGLTWEELSDDKWLNVIHENDREKTITLLEQSLRTGKDLIVEHRFKRFDGVYRWQLSRAVSLKDANGEIQMWIGTSTDIQEIKEQEELKDFFISMASHELKTPITSLKAYVQILLSNYKDTKDPFLLKSLKIADKQIVKLTNLISELLDISKIKSGKLSLKKEEFFINELVADTVDEFSITNPDYEISFKTEGEIKVKADIERISQVVINFLSNAIKYSPDSKKIEINCSVKGKEVEVSVIDHGIGINKIEMPKIFQRFFRGGGFNEKTIPGFGIGLFIAEEIINRHGGFIGAESEPGKGSRFYFTLPLLENSGTG